MIDKHLIIVEHNNKNILNSTFSAISAANILTSTTSVLILAKDNTACKLLIQNIKFFVDNVYYICHKDFTNNMSDVYANSIASVLKNMKFDYIWGGSSSFMKEMLPRLSALVSNSNMLSDVQKIINNNTFEKLMWSGNIISTIKISSDIKIISVRPTDFQNTLVKKEKNNSEELSIQVKSSQMKFLNLDLIQLDRPSLSDANVVVSGGRGLKNADNFKSLIFPLADTLNAAVGASRAICDASWVPNDWQVGQTGKVVAPKLYFAIGISGAIQHVAGMRGSKIVVAINKDIEAPIFQVADFGIVGDAQKIVPELTQQIKELFSK